MIILNAPDFHLKVTTCANPNVDTLKRNGDTAGKLNRPFHSLVLSLIAINRPPRISLVQRFVIYPTLFVHESRKEVTQHKER